MVCLYVLSHCVDYDCFPVDSVAWYVDDENTDVWLVVLTGTWGSAIVRWCRDRSIQLCAEVGKLWPTALATVLEFRRQPAVNSRNTHGRVQTTAYWANVWTHVALRWASEALSRRLYFLTLRLFVS